MSMLYMTKHRWTNNSNVCLLLVLYPYTFNLADFLAIVYMLCVRFSRCAARSAYVFLWICLYRSVMLCNIGFIIEYKKGECESSWIKKGNKAREARPILKWASRAIDSVQAKKTRAMKCKSAKASGNDEKGKNINKNEKVTFHSPIFQWILLLR